MTTTDRMTVAEAREALEKAGYWTDNYLTPNPPYREIGVNLPQAIWPFKTIPVGEGGTVSRSEVMALVERIKK